MFGFGEKPVSVATINQKATVSRKVARAGRVREAIERAKSRKDKDRVRKLQAELDAITESLLDQKAEIEALLKKVN